MSLLALPDEILLRICNLLDVYDLSSLAKVPVIGPRIARFYMFYHDETIEARFLVKKLEDNSPIYVYSLEDSPEDYDPSEIWSTFIILGQPNDQIILDKIKDMSQKASIKIISTSKSLVNLIESRSIFESCRNTVSICFLNLWELGMVQITGLDPGSLDFPELHELTLVCCTATNDTSKFKMPKISSILFGCSTESLSILKNFDFEKYDLLQLIKLTFLDFQNDVNIGDITFGKAKEVHLALNHNGFPTNIRGHLKNVSMEHVSSLVLTDFTSLIDIDAPNLTEMTIDINTSSFTKVKFSNFNAPKLLRIGTTNPDFVLFDTFENFNAPLLKEIDINELSLRDNPDYVFENLRTISTAEYTLWHGKFNSLVLTTLEISLGPSMELYNDLKATDFPSLRNLQIHSHSPCDLSKIPFGKTYPSLLRLEFFGFYNVQSDTLNQLLSRCPSLKELEMEPQDAAITIDGVSSDTLEDIRIFPNEDTFQKFEMTNCHFKKLKKFFIAPDIDTSMPDQFDRFSGRIEMIAPNLESILVGLKMETIDLSKFKTTKLQRVLLRGPVSEIELGDIQDLEDLHLFYPFTKLGFGQEPAALHNFTLPDKLNFPAVSEYAVMRLMSIYRNTALKRNII